MNYCTLTTPNANKPNQLAIPNPNLSLFLPRNYAIHNQ